MNRVSLIFPILFLLNFPVVILTDTNVAVADDTTSYNSSPVHTSDFNTILPSVTLVAYEDGNNNAPKEISREMEELLLFFDEEDLIIITATKSPKKIKDAPAIASVISAKQIRDLGARSLLDILKIVPGIGISKTFYHGINGIESRGIRSLYSEKVLIMIDGQRVNSITTGGATWVFDDLMVENIKRVEVIRGPGSALYGANAFVAVINVVTYDPGDIEGVDLRASVGSFDTQRYNLMFGKKFSELKVAGFFDFFDTNGPELNIPSDSIGQNGKTDDWKEKYDVGLKASYKDFSFNIRYINKNRGPYIGAAPVLNDESRIDTDQLFTELKYQQDIGDDLQVTIKGYYDRFFWKGTWEVFPEGSPGFPDGMTGIAEAKNKIFGTEIQADYKLGGNNTITAGIVLEQKEQYGVGHRGNYDPKTDPPILIGPVQDIALWQKNEKRRVTAFYLQDVWKFLPALEGTFGLRYDHYSDFGETINPRTGLVWQLSEKTNIKLLYGSAFRAPNFVELYNDNNPAQVGNPDLDPEKIQTYEMSVDYQFNENLSWNITYFYNDIKDTIGLSGTDFANLGKTKVDGVEVEFKTRFSMRNYGYLNYTYQEARDGDTGAKLPGVATQKGNLGVNLGITEYLNINSNLLVVGPKPRGISDTRGELSGYEVVDLSMILSNFYKGAEIRASIYNFFDETYADPDNTGAITNDFPREGRSFILEARYKF